MPEPIQDTIQNALTTRLNLQIMLSSLPVVEEWMDAELAQWLESVPFMPEVPEGSPIHLRVTMGSDFSRLRWSAYGHPSGFIPKMAAYLEQVGIAPQDLETLNNIGGSIEPSEVGTWIAVAPEQIIRGWQFCESRPFSQLAPLIAQDVGTDPICAWLDEHKLTNIERFSRSIGDNVLSLIEVAIPSASSQLPVVFSSFETLLGKPINEAVRRGMESIDPDSVSATIYFAGGAVVGAGVLCNRVHNDDIACLCTAAQVDYNHKLPQVQGVLQADGAYRAEYRTLEGRETLDIEHIPGESKSPGPNLSKN